MVSGVYVLGRELRLIPFNTWAAWAAVALGAIWLAGAALQKALDQRERVRRQTEADAKRATDDAGGTQAEREP